MSGSTGEEEVPSQMALRRFRLKIVDSCAPNHEAAGLFVKIMSTAQL